MSNTTAELTLIRPDRVDGRQESIDFVGICDRTAKATGIAMQLTIIPPGAIATPHLHPHHETAIYILSGRVELRYGSELQQTCICEAGDFIFTPAGVPHQPRNLSANEPVCVLAARNDPHEREDSVLYQLEGAI